jgi:DnaJ-class molecular chaperone
VSDQDAAAQPAEPQPCPPCSGSGKVISNLGGSPSTIDCPWCEGTGVFMPEHDAQAHWQRGQEAPEQA